MRQKIRSYIVYAIPFIVAVTVQVFVSMGSSGFWSKFTYSAYDLTAKSYSDTAIVAKPNQHVVYVDIDERTYVKWGKPLVTPNRHIADILDILVSTKARFIIIDIDIAYELNDDDGIYLQDKLDNLALAEMPSLIFVRNLDPNGGKPIPTKYDRIIDKKNGISWSTYVVQRDSDGVVRSLNNTGNCDNNNLTRSVLEVVRSLNFENLTKTRAKCRSSQRFLYSFNQNLNKGEMRPFTYVGKSLRPVFSKISAYDLLAEEDINRAAFENAIVMIGNSNAAARNEYLTPLGLMSGSVILANAVYSEIVNGPLIDPTLALKIVLTLLITLIPVLTFRYVRSWGILNPSIPTLLVSVLLFFIWYFVSPIFLYGLGWWMDIIATQIAVAISLEVLEIRALVDELKSVRRVNKGVLK